MPAFDSFNLHKTLLVAGISVVCMASVFTASVAEARGQGNGYGRNAQVQQTNQTLSDQQIESLLFMREEEKLARDVYQTLYQRWGLSVFQNIAAAEQRHMNSVLRLLEDYRLVDPVVDDSVGSFTNPQLLALYHQLVEQGSRSVTDALLVGAWIEEIDIQDLQTALSSNSNARIERIYSNLLRGSYNHLRAFVGLLTSQGSEYQAQVLEQSAVDAILEVSHTRGNNQGAVDRGQGRGRGRW